MIWQIDSATQIAARMFPVPINSTSPICQYAGHETDAACWQPHLMPGNVFPPGKLICSPSLIINEFKAAHYLQGVALTISWGGMGRTQRYIYRQHNLQTIHNVFIQCSQSIRQSGSIQQSWDLLTTRLLWTPVMASKTLHFLCRALGFSQDVPVPIDNKVILDRVWPKFKSRIPLGQCPQDWKGVTFEAYCRYMTAILEWANVRGWTTIQLEPTIFAENL